MQILLELQSSLSSGTKVIQPTSQTVLQGFLKKLLLALKRGSLANSSMPLTGFHEKLMEKGIISIACYLETATTRSLNQHHVNKKVLCDLILEGNDLWTRFSDFFEGPEWVTM